MRVVGRVTKKLLCPQCDDVLADVSYRPLAWSLTLVAPDGRPLVPQQGSIHVRRAEQQLASASCPVEEQQAREGLQDIKRRLGELMYDLPCHRGITRWPRRLRSPGRCAGPRGTGCGSADDGHRPGLL